MTTTLKDKVLPDLSAGENKPSELLYQLLTDLPGHVCWKNLEGEYIGCNQAFADTLHLDSPEAIIGKTDFDLLPNNKDAAETVRRNDRFVMKSKMSKDFIEHVIDKDQNSAVYLSKKSPLINKDGDVIGMHCVAFDVTRHLKSLSELDASRGKRATFIKKMRYLETIADWLPGNVYWMDRDCNVIGTNKNLKKIHEYLEAGAPGENIYDFLPKEDLEILKKNNEMVMSTGEVMTLTEKGLDHNGNPVTYLSNKVPLRDESNNIIGLVGISLDISERIQLEESLKKAKATAELNHQAKNDFLMNMSHDLRTPFTGIMGSAELLCQTESDPMRKEMLEIILQSAQKVLTLIDEIIELASLDPNREQELQPLDIPTLCQEVVDIMTPQTKNKGLELRLTLPDTTSETLMGNKMALQRILLNLVGNAVKFTDSGHIEVSADVVQAIDENQSPTLQLCVSDTGIGIPENKQSMIFEKFYRVSAAAEGQYQGTGLGLHIVKSEIERMGGKISVCSTPGEGTTFTCMLPLQKAKR